MAPLISSGVLVVTATPAATVAPTGTVLAWGYNGSRQTDVPAAARFGVVDVAAGDLHSLALKSDGTVIAWGDNRFGQTSVPAGLTGITAIADGGYHSVALKSDGTVAAWGDNGYGQTRAPAGLTEVTEVTAGYFHTLALKSDGTVVAWGDDDQGQTRAPAGLTGVTAITAGLEHSVALKGDGTVVAWGRNQEGQTIVPDGLSGVIAIAAGYHHTVALKSDGTVVAWGQSAFGQTSVPGGLTGVTAIAAGGLHSVALRGEGTLVAWGDNHYGETAVPPGLTGVSAINAGFAHTVVVAPDATRPDTTITAGPTGLTSNQTLRFEFTSTEPGSSFECRVDAAAFAPCTSPYAAMVLIDGAHAFEVRAIDPAGNVDPTADSRRFTIDATAPDTTITAGPPRLSGDPTPSFEFTSTEPGSSFQCRVDNAPFTPCALSYTTTQLTEGAHTFQVQATDQANNVDTSPDFRTFTVDTTAPNTKIIASPRKKTRKHGARFVFTSSEAGSTFVCQLDKRRPKPCTSPTVVRSLKYGRHVFRVGAIDTLGNNDLTPATRVWRIRRVRR